ncbi:sugar phosphate isomerase, partial [Streptomyces anthocyanicus]
MNPSGDGSRSLPDALAGALDRALAPDAAAWLEQACAAVRCEPGEVEGTFAVAARRCGRGALDAGAEAGAGADAGTGLGAGWSVDDA